MFTLYTNAKSICVAICFGFPHSLTGLSAKFPTNKSCSTLRFIWSGTVHIRAHVPGANCQSYNFSFFFSLLVRPLRGIPANRGLPARGVEAGNCLGPLSSPFPYGGEQCGPRKFCSVTQSTAESHLLLRPCKKRPYRLNRAGLQLQLPVCPTPAASSLAHHHRTLVNVWLKAGLSCRGSGSQH